MDLNLVLLLFGSLLGLFVAVTLAQQGMAKVSDRIRSARMKAPIPPQGVAVRIRTREATYSTRFLGSSTAGWAFDSLAHAIPTLRMGEPAVVEISCPGGALRFRSEVVDIRADKDAMLMRPPLEGKVGERRGRRRIVFDQKARVMLENTPAWLVDIGEGGARLLVDQSYRRGERVKLMAEGLTKPIVGHVLEATAPRGHLREVRIVFEECVPLRQLKKKFAPAR